MSKEFKQGQTVYSELGQAAEYVAKIPDGHIVRPEVEAYDGDEEYTHLCDPVTWRTVFLKVPTDKYSEELKALHKQIEEARETRRKEDAADRARAQERAAKLKRFAVLDCVEAFIDGRITHYVTTETYGPPEIIPIAEAITNESSGRYRHALRLLTLGGEIREGKVSWVLNQYSDGSGSGKGVQPCTSLEEAEAIVKKAIAINFAKHQPDIRQSWIDAAEKLSVPVPESYMMAARKERLAQLVRDGSNNYTRRQAREYAEAVAKMDQEIAELQAALGLNGEAV